MISILDIRHEGKKDREKRKAKESEKQKGRARGRYTGTVLVGLQS